MAAETELSDINNLDSSSPRHQESLSRDLDDDDDLDERKLAIKRPKWHRARESHAKLYDESEHKPLLFPSMIVAYPRACFWSWCCVMFLAIILTVALTMAGLEPITLDRIDEVGLDLPHDRYYLISQAFLRTPAIANFVLDSNYCERVSISTPLNIILVHEDDKNVLTAAGLSRLKGQIDHIEGHSEYSTKCALTYGTCDSNSSVQIYQTSPGCCVERYTNIPAVAGSGTYNITNDQGCFAAKSPVFYFEKYGDPTFSDIPGTIATIKATSSSDYANLVTLFGKDFDETAGTSSLLSATFYFGTPLNGTETDGIAYDDSDDVEKLEEWIDKAYLSYLEKQYNKSPYKLLFFWSGYDPVGGIIILDLSLVFIGIVLVYGYMWYTFGSLFLASCAMYGIFMAFFGANLIYRYLWPTDSGIGYKYFALFNALSIFIILGIGADDTFVFSDTWRENQHGRFRDDAQTLSAVYVKAGKAMLVTSLTTVISFFANMSSEFVGIKSFGAYAGLLVIVNYVGVVSYFPCVVYYHHKFLRGASYLCCCDGSFRNDVEDVPEDNDRDNAMTPRVPSGNDDENDDENDAPNAEPEGFLGKAKACCVSFNKWRKDFDLGTFLKTTYTDFLFANRYIVVAMFGCVIVVFLVFASMIVPQPFKVYELLPPGTNFHDYLFTLYEEFPTSATPLYAYIVFGFDEEEPLVYKNDFEDYQFVFGEDGSGTPQFNASFDIQDPLFQLQFFDTCHWIANEEVFSYKGLKVDRTYGVNPQLDPGSESSATGGEFGVQCIFDAFAQYANVSRYDASNTVYSSSGTIDDYSDGWLDYTGEECRYCFHNFTLSPGPGVEYVGEPFSSTTYAPSGHSFPNAPVFMENTSSIIDGCNCLGIFPVPQFACLGELSYLAHGTRFQCIDGSYLQDDLASYVLGDQDALDWWQDYAYASTDYFGEYERIVMTYIKVQTTLSEYENDFEKGLDLVKAWDDWKDEYNKRVGAAGGTKAQIYIPTAYDWVVTSRLAPNAIQNTIISLALAFVVLLLATTNWIMASLAIMNVGLIVTVIFGFMQMAGWGLGVLESILCVLVVGFSVDFTIHLTDTYAESFEPTRLEKVREALGTTGVSVVSGATSTLLASMPMLFATISFFSKFGAFMFLTMGLSLIFSLGFLASLLMIVGPLGTSGSLAHFYGPIIMSAYSSLEESKTKADAEDKMRQDAIAELKKASSKGNTDGDANAAADTGAESKKD